MMIVLAVLCVIWVVGWFYTIPTIYRALLANQLREMHKKQGRYDNGVVELNHGDVVNSAVAATLAGMFWYLGVPFFVSKWIRDHRKVEITDEINRAEEDHRHAEQLKVQMRKLTREIETTSVETSVDRPDPWRGHERF